MEVTIVKETKDGKQETTYELDLGIGFALHLDSKFKFKQKIQEDLDMEFGLGVQILYGRLAATSIEAIVDFYNAGLSEQPKRAFSQKELQKAIQAKALELGGFDKLAEHCIEELKDVGLYPHIFEASEAKMAMLREQ